MPVGARAHERRAATEVVTQFDAVDYGNWRRHKSRQHDQYLAVYKNGEVSNSSFRRRLWYKK
jgi:hypothetical protein